VVEPTHLKNMNVKMGSSSPNSGENQEYLKPPPSSNTSPLKEGPFKLSQKRRGFSSNYQFCQGLSNRIPGSNSTSEGLFIFFNKRQTNIYRIFQRAKTLPLTCMSYHQKRKGLNGALRQMDYQSNEA